VARGCVFWQPWLPAAPAWLDERQQPAAETLMEGLCSLGGCEMEDREAAVIVKGRQRIGRAASSLANPNVAALFTAPRTASSGSSTRCGQSRWIW
jgi:hypothetical protein